MSDKNKALTEIALSNSIPFRYSCNICAPSGICTICGREYLMSELPRVAVEYSTDCLLREVMREYLTSANTLDNFEESVAECYPETVNIVWIEYDTVSALQELDPVSWEIRGRTVRWKSHQIRQRFVQTSCDADLKFAIPSVKYSLCSPDLPM